MAEDPDAGRTPSGRETLSNWPGGENSPYLSTGADDATSSYPYLPPVPEEPGSSISEGTFVKYLRAINFSCYCQRKEVK